MSTTLQTASGRVMRQLDDEDGDVWTRSQVDSFIQDGYEKLCRETDCLYDMHMFDSQPQAGNYTRAFEVEYMTGMPIFGQFTFTKESDRQYAGPGAIGPANHTKHSDPTYMTDPNEPPSSRTIGFLPKGFTSVERVTHDWLRLMPESANYLRRSRNIYTTEQGGVFSYSMDQDGLFVFRTVGVPVTHLQTTTHTVSGTFGPIRAFTSTDGGQDLDPDNEDVVAPDGGYGIIRQIPRHFVMKSHQYGAIRQVIVDTNNTRVEFFRLGADLTKSDFEIPDRFVKYVEWWALHRAYTTPGEGEDPAMASHYEMRFKMGVGRMKKRVEAQMDERAMAMGHKRHGSLDSYLQRFPSDYGYKTGFHRGGR